MIEPIVSDKQFNRIGIVDDYISLIWTARYYTCGDFEICVDANKKNMQMLQSGFYILRDDDDNVGIIEDIKIETNEEQKETLIVTGRFLDSIMSRRIIATQIQIDDSVSNGIFKLLNENIITPSMPERKITNFIVGGGEIKDKLSAQYTGKNLMSVIDEICETYEVGHKVKLNEHSQFVFFVYAGVNRSYNQTENQPVVFSDTYDNLLSSEYIESNKETVTDVLVAGEGEGLERKTLWVSKEHLAGLDRYEKYSDSRNLSTNKGEINEAEYNAHMQEVGLENITDFTTAFSGTVYFDNIRYKKDVSIGDICVIENSTWGISINSRLVQVMESVNESGVYSITPTFGT